jgi:tetratricopeptide (TPR) repeat protein
MDLDAQGCLPRGFAGTVTSFRQLLPVDALRLPAAAIPDGPCLRVPPGPHRAIAVEALPESFGNLERFLRALVAELADGGELCLDAGNAQSPAALRHALEGRPGVHDPIGSLQDPERFVLPRRLLRAAQAAGLWIEDLVAVPAGRSEVGPDFARALFREGFHALAYVPAAAPARLWLRARKLRLLPGSALIGAGPAALQERTAALARALLPAGWEIVIGEGGRESESWNLALPRARGEVLWLLRAGSAPSRAAFDNLLARTVLSPAVPGREGEALRPGDLDGLMLSRVDFLLAGPIPRGWRNDTIAYEDFGMRLDAIGRTPHPVDGEWAGPAAPSPAPRQLAAEGQALLHRWRAIGPGERHTSADDPHARAHQDRVVPWNGRRPRISLCMICKNEERFLDDCLRRAAAAVDEIVLVDTGSTDQTLAIAERHGARVLRVPWTDDFSAPRNAGLQAATGDWILVLDADEMLEDGAAGRIRQLVEDAGVAGYHLRFRNVYTGGKTIGVLMVRLFRNLPGVRYANRIHEQVTPSLLAAAIASGLILSIADVEVAHYGYTDELMRGRSKDERNERLFRLQLAEHPDDLYSLYKYGDFLRRLEGRDAEVIAVLERAFAQLDALPPHQLREIPYAGEIAALLALEHARAERVGEAERVVQRALALVVPTPNLHYIAASLALAQRRNDEAIAHFERCLGYRDQVLIVPIQDGVTSWVSVTGIAQAHLQNGDREQAERLLRQAIALQPDYEPATLLRSRLHCEAAEFGPALAALTGFLARHPESAGACQQATMILLRLGQKEQAHRLGRRAIELLQRRGLRQEAQRMQTTLIETRTA